MTLGKITDLIQGTKIKFATSFTVARARQLLPNFTTGGRILPHFQYICTKTFPIDKKND